MMKRGTFLSLHCYENGTSGMESYRTENNLE